MRLLVVLALLAAGDLSAQMPLGASTGPWGQAGPTYCYPITIDHTKVPSTQTNFPVLFRSPNGTVTTIGTAVTLSTGDQFPTWFGNNTPIMINGVDYLISSRTSGTILVLQSSAGTQASPVVYSGTPYLAQVGNGSLAKVQNASGYDIGFYSNNSCSTKLDWEAVTWAATTGIGEWWYRVASLSSASDTVVYLGYGNASTTTDQSNKTATWSTDFYGVWHLPNGSSLTANDSTSHADNGTITNVTAVAGEIDGAGHIASAANESIDFGGSTLFSVGTADFSVAAWINSADTNFDILMSNYAGGNHFWWGMNSGKMTMSINGGSTATSASVNTGAWVYVVATRVSGTVTNYINASADGSGAQAGNISSAGNLIVGKFGSLNSNYWNDGAFDELRVLGVGASADWITTNLNSQGSPFVFWSTTAQ